MLDLDAVEAGGGELEAHLLDRAVAIVDAGSDALPADAVCEQGLDAAAVAGRQVAQPALVGIDHLQAPAVRSATGEAQARREEAMALDPDATARIWTERSAIEARFQSVVPPGSTV